MHSEHRDSSAQLPEVLFESTYMNLFARNPSPDPEKLRVCFEGSSHSERSSTTIQKRQLVTNHLFVLRNTIDALLYAARKSYMSY
jgi:hypothetical protein